MWGRLLLKRLLSTIAPTVINAFSRMPGQAETPGHIPRSLMLRRADEAGRSCCRNNIDPEPFHAQRVLQAITSFFIRLRGWACQNETLLSRLTSMSPLPNQLAITVYSLDAMQRDSMGFPFAVIPFKNAMAVFGKLDVGKRLHHKAALDAVVKADSKFGTAELFVPADAIKQVLNGQHD
jgi:hypothetical protein